MYGTVVVQTSRYRNKQSMHTNTCVVPISQSSLLLQVEVAHLFDLPSNLIPDVRLPGIDDDREDNVDGGDDDHRN